MRPLVNSRFFRSPSAFTLIELLVVIAILGVLGSLMASAVVGVMKRVKVARAETAVQSLKQAIGTYTTEYRKLPLRDAASSGAEALLPTGRELMDVLCASDSEAGKDGLNPKRTPFYTDRVARPLGKGRHHSGVLVDGDGSAELFDPWGSHYFVLFDTDNDGRVSKPNWDERTSSTAVMQSVLVWSAGPDGDPETGEDNVFGW